MTMGGPYTDSVCIRVEPETAQALAEHARAEHRKVGDFARQLLVWAMDRYEAAGSLHDLETNTSQPNQVSRTLAG